MNNPDNDSPPPPPPRRRWRQRLPWLRRDGDGDGDEDPIDASARELSSSGRWPAAIVGPSLGFAAWWGHVDSVRSSLALLATAAIVIMVLGSDALRRGAERGFDTPDRQAVAVMASGTMFLGRVGVVLAAALLPWLGSGGAWVSTRLLMAVFVGIVGTVLGTILGAPLALAVSDLRVRRQERDSSPPEPGNEPPPRPGESTPGGPTGEAAP